MPRGGAITRLAALAAAPSSAPAQVLVLDDPLTSEGEAVIRRDGGRFSADGWTRDGFASRLVFDLGRAITRGRMRFEMDGVNGRDHGSGGTPPCRAIFAAIDSDGSGNLGNQNYEIPAGVDLSEYQGVVIYCVPFHVVFATATLS